MDKIILRIGITLIITWLYCMVWCGLEKVIDGEIVNRTVDNIIMLLFIPIIYLATANFID